MAWEVANMRWLFLSLVLCSAGCLEAKDPNGGDGGGAGGGCNGRTGSELGDAFGGFGELLDCEEVSHEFGEIPRGDVVLFNISTGWCIPCREETPDFQEFFEAHEAEGVSIIQVLMEDDAGNPAATGFCTDWRDEFSLTYTLLFDTAGNVSRSFFEDPATQMPLNIVVDLNGCVTYRTVGTGGGFAAIEEALLAAL